MNYYVGLDNGGTTTKAAIFDAKGKEIATASTATKMLVPQPGFTERDMEEMWEANCLVIREALKKSGAAPADIRCVAVCGHGKGLYLWGKDGRPAYHGIISTDNPGLEVYGGLAEGRYGGKGISAFLPARAGQPAGGAARLDAGSQS